MRYQTKPYWLHAALILLVTGWAFCFGGLKQEVGELAQLLKLAPGQVVGDVGAGDGQFSEALALRVGPEGRVIATEVEDDKILRLRRLTREHPNLTVVAGDQSDTGLPAGCCDAVLLRLVYHHFEQPEAMGRDLRAALKPGGRLALVDFPPDNKLPRRSVPKFRNGHGIEAQLVIDEMTSQGFKLLRQVEHWQGDGDHYLLLFERLP